MSTWVKLHDNFATNLKVLAAGEDAAWLYVCGLLFCSANETDGRIPIAALRNLTAKKDAKTLARILVREGLWTETAQGWEVHDYLKVQRSKAQIEAEREKARNRKARSRSGHAVTTPVTDGVTDADVTQPEAVSVTETDSSSLPSSVPDAVWERLARKKMMLASQQGTLIRDAVEYQRTVIKNDRAALGERAQELWDRFDITPSHLADVLAAGGSSQSLNHLRKREPA